MHPLFLSFLLLVGTDLIEFPVPNDPPVITVSSMEPYELSNGVIISTSDNDGHVIEVKTDNGYRLKAAVFDSEGNRIPSIYLDEANELDLSQLAPGEYILRVVDEAHNMNMYRIKRAK